jgi:hypothetical protein
MVKRIRDLENKCKLVCGEHRTWKCTNNIANIIKKNNGYNRQKWTLYRKIRVLKEDIASFPILCVPVPVRTGTARSKQ